MFEFLKWQNGLPFQFESSPGSGLRLRPNCIGRECDVQLKKKRCVKERTKWAKLRLDLQAVEENVS